LQAATSHTTSPRIKEWCEKHGFTQESIHHPSFYFESRAVHQLCAAVLQEGGTEDTSFREFAEQVVKSEIRVLLVHALQQAGYTVQGDNDGKLVIDDENGSSSTTTTMPTGGRERRHQGGYSNSRRTKSLLGPPSKL
jgi:hypothetical protein